MEHVLDFRLQECDYLSSEELDFVHKYNAFVLKQGEASDFEIK